MSVEVRDYEYREEYQCYFWIYDLEAGLIGCTRPALNGLPDPDNNPVGIAETYRKAYNDLQDMELK